MTKSKFKMSFACLSVVLVLALVASLCGIFFTPKANADNGVQAVAVSEDANSYIGSVEDNYATNKGYSYSPDWQPIGTAQALSDFIKNPNGKNGWLTADITINWADFGGDKNGLAPAGSQVTTILDGCGYKITLTGSVDIGDGYNNVEGTKPGNVPNPVNGNSQPYVCTGGIANVLTGKIQNLSLVINGAHKTVPYGDQYQDIMGGLVGYNNGGTISNVSVELVDATEFGVYTGGEYKYGEGNVATAMLGIIAGDNNGVIKNVKARMSGDSYMKANGAGSTWLDWFTKKGSNSYAVAGGIVGLNRKELTNVLFESYSTTTKGESILATGWGGMSNHGYAALIAGQNKSAITNAMVSGNINNKANGEGDNSMERIFVGGTNDAGPSGKYGYNLDTNSTMNDSVDRVLTTDDANTKVYFDKEVDGQMKVFAPEGKFLWKVADKDLVPEIESIGTLLTETSFLNPTSGTEITCGTEEIDATVGYYNGDQQVIGTAPYKGSAYEIKIRLNNGTLIPANADKLVPSGNLTDAGEYSITCDHKVAYIDKTNKVVVMHKKLFGCEEKLTITPAEVTMTRNGFEGNSVGVYDGASITFNGLIGEDTITVGGTEKGNNDPYLLNVANPSLSISLANQNYILKDSESNQIYLTINPKEITIFNDIKVDGLEVVDGKITLNDATRTELTVSATFEMYGKTYGEIIANVDGSVTDIKNTNTEISAKVAVSKDLSEIKLGEPVLQTVTITVDGEENIRTFGSLFTQTAYDDASYTFVGWYETTNDTEELITYANELSIRPTRNMSIIAKYTTNVDSDTITHTFKDWEGNVYKTVKSDIADMSDATWTLPDELAWNFEKWILDTKNSTETEKFYEPYYAYDASAGIIVNVNGDEVYYNQEIALEQGEYTINGAKVVVGEEGMTINAITDLTITKEATENTATVATNEVIVEKDTYYINTTLICNEELRKENAIFFDFGKDIVMNVDKFVKKGDNVYQFVLKFSESDLNAVFGSDKVDATLYVNGNAVGTSFVVREVK